MCDTVSTLRSSAIFWVISLLPSAIASYTGLGITSASLAVYILHRQSPSERLGRLEDAIKAGEEILKRAKSVCGREYVSLVGLEGRLLQYVRPAHVIDSGNNMFRAKLSASKIQTRILKAGDDKVWQKYLQTLRGIMQSIDECARQVKEVHTETLLTMEDERQRQISEGIKESQEVIATANSPLCRRAHLPLHRRQPTDNYCYSTV
ncbi:hypothetical protein B0H11DRAFT_259498 [Mycena galericulata]|nr:hypothetical protein B0H11DRAFT_259498 [Mycena galericulata]